MFKQIRDTHQESEESLDLLMQIWMRFILSCSSLVVLFVDPVESGLPVELTQMLLIFYSLYSACFVFVYDMQLFREFTSNRAAHWIDALFYSCLIALTGGADSHFFFFFFFPILVASFTWGFREGLKVTLASCFLFVFAGLVSVLQSKSFGLGEAVLRPIYIFVFGYTIAHWGEGRILLKRRLRLLHDVSINWNPRFGANHAIKMTLEKLVEFYQGSRCILVMSRAEQTPKFVMHVTDPQKTSNLEAPSEITETTAKELLVLPDSIAASFKTSKVHSLRYLNKYIAYDIDTHEPIDRYFNECETLSILFDTESFISVPYRQQDVTSGRIYLIAGNSAFNRSDIAFTVQVSDVLSSVVENMLLVESLIAEAGGHERHRISLDVHDTTIQPYIGLTLALDALSREYKSDIHLTEKIGEILNMAYMTIQDLRSYKDTLREKSLMRGDFLVSAVNIQAERLLRFYGIHVEVRGAVDPNLNGKLAEAAFQIVKEGLSNILRHTSAKKAFVSVQSNDTQLLVEIGNEPSNAPSVLIRNAPKMLMRFKPKSIYERALSLNGETVVEYDTEGYTVVRVTIPLIKD